MTRNLILTGFMGTGKSTVGQLVATQLGRQFLDMDALIEEREGRPIPQIFTESGEPYFRQLEVDLGRELAMRSGLVIATGGGALVSEANLRVMEQNGLVICLDCQPEVLWQRIGQSDHRPMLAARDEERFARLSALLTQRGPAYARIQRHLDVTNLSPEEAAQRICEFANERIRNDYSPFAHSSFLFGESMQTLTVTHPGGSYPIILGEGALSQTGPRLAQLGYKGRCALITNEVVGPRHAPTVLDSLQAAGFEPVSLTLPDGEPFKTLDTVADLYPQLIAAKLDRRSPILALGGGVLGDTVGFAAATYLRGVPFVQIPTTLLSMVDASVGGKTGVDLPEGKNLVGAFKQPEMVVIDPHVLTTLPPAEYRAGLAEVVKHGVIDSPALFAELEVRSREYEVRGNSPTPYSLLPTPWLHEAVMVKVRVVQEDPFEQGRRAVLNLGHTFAHAFERLANFELRHGEAVAMGTACAARLSVRMGHCSEETAARIITLLDRLGLPTQPPAYPPADVWAAMSADKKRQGNTLRFILIQAIGKVDIFDNVAREDVLAIL